MDDLIQRLGRLIPLVDVGQITIREAADTIERQAAEIEKLTRWNKVANEHADKWAKEVERQAALLKMAKGAIVRLYGCYPPSYGTDKKTVVAREALRQIEEYEREQT